MRKIIMSWSKQRSFIGKTAAGGAMAADLDLCEIDGIKDKSTTLSVTEGDKMQMYATGHELVAEETTEGDYELTLRVIEPTFELLAYLGLGEAGSGDDFLVSSHVVDGDWSLKVQPKNAGGKGLKAPKCKITYTPGYSEEDGHYADLKFKVLKGEAAYWYSLFRKADVAKPKIAAAANSITVTCATEGATLMTKVGEGEWTAYSDAITATAETAGQQLLARAVKGNSVSEAAAHTIAYAAS